MVETDNAEKERVSNLNGVDIYQLCSKGRRATSKRRNSLSTAIEEDVFSETKRPKSINYALKISNLEEQIKEYHRNKFARVR